MHLVALFISVFGLVFASSNIYESGLSKQLSELNSNTLKSDEYENSFGTTEVPFMSISGTAQRSFLDEHISSGYSDHGGSFIFSAKYRNKFFLSNPEFVDNYLKSTGSMSDHGNNSPESVSARRKASSDLSAPDGHFSELMSSTSSVEVNQKDTGDVSSDPEEEKEVLIFEMDDFEEIPKKKHTLAKFNNRSDSK